MNSDSADRILGEYHLRELVSENSISRTWLADQVSVQRRVLVDELKADQAGEQQTFLANVRAKAAVEHPLIGSVFEAVSEPGCCFYAHELLSGETLEDRRIAKQPFQPIRLAHFLRRVSEAHLQHEALDQATSALGLNHIHLDDQGVLRLDNLAIAGPRPHDQSARDITRLGAVLPELVANGRPGATRLLTLLAWMRGEGVDAPINWEQVRDYCSQIEQQLTAPTRPISPTRSIRRSHKKPPMAIVAVAGGLALLVILGLALRMRPEKPTPPPTSNLPDTVLIPKGRHPTPDGTREALQAFRISSHEVTIGEYAEFVETLETLAENNRERTFDHESQPSDKNSHLPDDWPALLAAAKANEKWNDKPVTLDSPVIGVDWWDAAAYAEWKQSRLPTQEEWFAALNGDVAVPAAITPSDWIPVNAETTDRTPQGIRAMAGSVAEWTRRPATNPTNPLGERKWVIIGGSYLKPGSNALSREWTDDRSLRRPDLGFRLVSDES